MKRALVVDDSRTARLIFKRQLALYDLEIEEAGDGEQAWEILQTASRFDLMLLDWTMPKKDGYSLLCDVRADRRFDGMKIMMVTTENELGLIRDALQAGANEYLVKPFIPDMLREKLTMLGMVG